MVGSFYPPLSIDAPRVRVFQASQSYTVRKERSWNKDVIFYWRSNLGPHAPKAAHVSVYEWCRSYGESSKGSKERQGPWYPSYRDVCLIAVSVYRELTILSYSENNICDFTCRLNSSTDHSKSVLNGRAKTVSNTEY